MKLDAKLYPASGGSYLPPALRVIGGFAAALWLMSDPTCVAANEKTASDRGFEAVAEIFEARCVTCHNTNLAKGGFSLADASNAMAGGDSGKLIVAGDAANSILLDYVRGTDPNMPPEGDPLSAGQVAAIEKWIRDGAYWPDDRQLQESHLKDRSWWSLRPLKAVEVPTAMGRDRLNAEWPRNAIDHFVLRKLLANDLEPAPQAGRQTLIRRLYFDLIGLPPSPEAIEEFTADKRPDAYERLVDQLLHSERYGERWARHWLDVIHYGDTHGYDKDKPRPNAWPYRDYVIRSLNEDKPWSQFVREQIAGDVLYPNTRDGIEALGFISAGPWDFVGHAEVSEEKIDGQIARHLDRDDMVRTTTESLMGLTVGCAQCHDHKFDPITQRDYYQLQAVFAALDRADRSYDLDPQTSKQREALNQSIADARNELKTIAKIIVERAGKDVAEMDEAIRNLELRRDESFGKAFGYHSQIETQQNVSKWVQIDFGKQVAIRRIILFPCKDDFNGIGAGFGFPLRFKVQLSATKEFPAGVTTQTIADETQSDFENPKLGPVAYPTGSETARYLRVTATKLAPRKDDFIFALAEVEAIDDEGINHAKGKRVTAFDSIESGERWRQSNLTDGVYPGEPIRLTSLRKKRQQLIELATKTNENARLRELQSLIQRDEKKLASLPAQSKVYAGTIHRGTGKFKGTAANGGLPRPVHLLERGDVTRPGELVEPGALSVLGMDRYFAPDNLHNEADRRAALARWLTDSANPLTWRNAVNRVWQYHFGRGLVETPNDFGRMGSVPTHPDLLDYLAVQFRDQGQSLKQLHRLIVTSATWRQSSRAQSSLEERAFGIDADNRLLWKMPRRKLEAEAVRDSVLSVSGKLDLTMYGPGYRDFVIKNPEHSPHYEYHLHDPDDPQTHRRSIYRFVVRSQLEPFMNTLDCADPSILVGRRNSSLTPLQSLAMLNSGLIVTMAPQFASKIQKRYKGPDSQVQQAFYQAIGRLPNEAEQSAIQSVAQQHGLANACRLIFNLNEFTFVD
ncbi:MAG: DUF1553 domain-containing protein [Aureliella sp.]